MRWLVTGANGNLGRALIAHLLQDDEVVAVVRSQRALGQVEAVELAESARSRLWTKIIDYTDEDALRRAAEGCDCVVHLVGILKEDSRARYAVAHEQSSTALMNALTATAATRVIYLSIVGSSPQSSNACLASKGRAEAICRSGNSVAGCVIRVPMVLGEGDYASFALKKRAMSNVSFSFRAQSLEQPIYAGDVVTAIAQAGRCGVDGSYDLGGPQVLTRAALNTRAARILNRSTRTVSLPLPLGLGVAWVLEKVFANPPFTQAMLGVLDHDDDVDSTAAMQALGIAELTPLDDMLRKVLGAPST